MAHKLAIFFTDSNTNEPVFKGYAIILYIAEYMILEYCSGNPISSRKAL